MWLYACIVYCTEGDLRTAEGLSFWVNYHGAVCLYCSTKGDLRTAESLLFCAFHDRVVCLYCSVVLKGIFKTAES